MRLRILLVVVALAAVAQAAVFTDEEYQFLFSKFMTQYGKKYTEQTFFHRFTVFKANMDKIYLSNQQKEHTYTLGMNAMGDMTLEEFKATKLGYNHVERPHARKVNGPRSSSKMTVSAAAPASVDWRTKNAVTPIKDQGQCGSCWAFSATGSMEGAVAIASGELISLSEQQLVDCAGSFGNDGCQGGLMDSAFEYIIHNGGLTKEANYKYTAKDGKCDKAKEKAVAATISGYTDVSDSDTALMTAVALGPVSVAIEADQACFQFYSGGILNSDSCGTQLDHGVLVVGYDHSKGFWIVKNSWGTSWGLKGYVEIAQGKDECGINMQPSYPTGGKVVGTR